MGGSFEVKFISNNKLKKIGKKTPRNFAPGIIISKIVILFFQQAAAAH